MTSAVGGADATRSDNELFIAYMQRRMDFKDTEVCSISAHRFKAICVTRVALVFDLAFPPCIHLTTHKQGSRMLQYWTRKWSEAEINVRRKSS